MLRILLIAAVYYLYARGCAPSGAEVLTEAEVARVDSLLSASKPRPAQDQYGYVIDTLDRREVLRLLKAAQYDTLEALFEERWVATQADIRHEARLQHAYDAFIQGAAVIEPQLRAWISARPNSYIPHVAMAAHRFGRAQEARGSDAASETSGDQFASANQQAVEGVAAANEALRMAPDHLTAYVMRLELLSYLRNPDPDETRATLQAAVAAHPTSFQLRWTILEILQPRWGGSIELMRQFASTAEEHAPRNAKLNALAGAAPQEEAWMQRDDFGMALALLDQAKFYGDHYALAMAYGDLLAHHDSLVSALESYDRALSYSPQGRYAHERRGILLVRIGALTADEAVREKAWAEAKKSFDLARDLRMPDLDPSYWMGVIAEARATCRSSAPPCLTGM